MKCDKNSLVEKSHNDMYEDKIYKAVATDWIDVKRYE